MIAFKHRPMWEEFGFREVAPEVLTNAAGNARLLSAVQVWKMLRTNVARYVPVGYKCKPKSKKV